MNLADDILAITADEATYRDSIPTCCSLRTVKAHMEIGLCWGLTNHIWGNRKLECDKCELRLPNKPGDEHGKN